MSSIYKEKIIKEIETIPEKMMPRFYRIIHLLKTELYLSNEISNKRKRSLKGIWKDSEIDDRLLEEAKNSLFPYYRKSGLL